ncbi:hypothetical protein HYV86_06985 [Candidatus Woesearchaeota archaeon]|nr:hypothetical protein [Candidatus Woesearchaeota archaeon]
MVNSRRIEVRVRKQEHERIVNAAESRGFKTIAAYLRWLSLDNGLAIEEKILETNRLCIQILEILKRK